MLDMSAFSHIAVSDISVSDISVSDTSGAGTLVTVGSGATWGAVAEALREHDLALSSGDTSSVGVGGLTLGGGVGWIVRKYGLALDSVRSARIVTANGDLVTANAIENPDLYWAIRGGGGNFGVVVEFEFEAHPLSGVVHGVIPVQTDDLAAFLRGYRDVMRNSALELNATFMLMPEMPGMVGGAQLHVVWAGDNEAEAQAAIAPLLALPGVSGSDIQPKAYRDVLEDPHPPEPGEGGMPVIVGNNGWVPDFSDEAAAAVAALAERMQNPVVMIRYLRGAFNDVPADATAFAWRDAETLVIAFDFLPPDATADAIEAVDAAWALVAPFTKGTYGNFVSDAGEKAVGLMYPPATRARLAAIKRTWDPSNLFNQNQNIEPALNETTLS